MKHSNAAGQSRQVTMPGLKRGLTPLKNQPQAAIDKSGLPTQKLTFYLNF
jgi:hypothetical protein